MESGNSSNICIQIYPILFMFLIGNQTILDELIYGIIANAYFSVILESILQTIKVTTSCFTFKRYFSAVITIGMKSGVAFKKDCSIKRFA